MIKIIFNNRHLLFVLPISITGAVIVYANLIGRGSMWASDVVSAVFFSAVIIFTCSNFYISSCLKHMGKSRSWKLASMEIGAAILLLIFAWLAMAFACFPGIGNRHTNCGLDTIGDIALVVAAYTSIRVLPISFFFPVMTILSTIVIAFLLPSYTLWKMNSILDVGKHNETCVLEGSVYDKLSQYKKVSGPVTLGMIFPLGEGSPRLIFVKDGKYFIWKYSKFSIALLGLDDEGKAIIDKQCV